MADSTLDTNSEVFRNPNKLATLSEFDWNRCPTIIGISVRFRRNPQRSTFNVFRHAGPVVPTATHVSTIST